MKNYSESNPEILNEIKSTEHTGDTIATDRFLQEDLSMLRKLRLPCMAQTLSELCGEKNFLNLGLLEQIHVLLSSEITSRANSGYHRRLKQADLVSAATAEVIRERLKGYGLTSSVFEYLMSSQWVKEGKEIIIVGKSGLGKTELASAMVDAACRNGLKAKRYDYSLKIFELTECYMHGGSMESYHQTLLEMSSHQVVMFEDVCLGVNRAGEAAVFKDMLCELREHCRCGVILVSQKLPDEWHRFLGGGKSADAVVDRVLNRSYLIKLDGESYRACSPEELNQPEDKGHGKAQN